MSLSSSLASVGRAVAYYPRLSRFFGSVNASIFFAQLHYWQSRSSDELGVFKTADEWTEETGLSYREQATARKILAEMGVLHEENKRLQHRIYYRLDLDAVDQQFDQWIDKNSPNDENAFREMRNAQLGNCGKRNSRDAENAIGGVRKTQVGNKEEITAEITAEKKTRKSASTFVLPDWIDQAHWDAWHSTPKRKKATDAQKQMAVEKLAKWRDAGIDHALALENAAVGGWQGLFEPREGQGTGSSKKTHHGPKNKHADAYATILGDWR
ncbi:MAG: putative DNA replication protein [Caudoviricetes sp.]|nr:MAG: putative DNA replication protein [Caudoviricetes sp.]